MDIEKVNKVLELVAKRDKVVKFRDSVTQRGKTVSIDNDSGSSVLNVNRKKFNEDIEESWKVYNHEIKDLSCAAIINDAAEWYYQRVLSALEEQIEEYDKQIISL